MDDFDSDSGFDGEWDDRWELAWSEFDWKQYLRNSDRDIARFLTLHRSLIDHENRLDETARLMGWEALDWASLEDMDDAEAEAAEQREIEDDLEPYTLHKHPVFIAARALFRWLEYAYESFFRSAREANPADLAWQVCNVQRQADMQFVLAIQALDLGDFQLSVCHLKLALSALNEALGHVKELSHPSTRFAASFQDAACVRLFDLRELALRVMQDCREEVRRRYKDRD